MKSSCGSLTWKTSRKVLTYGIWLTSTGVAMFAIIHRQSQDLSVEHKQIISSICQRGPQTRTAMDDSEKSGENVKSWSLSMYCESVTSVSSGMFAYWYPATTSASCRDDAYPYLPPPPPAVSLLKHMSVASNRPVHFNQYMQNA